MEFSFDSLPLLQQKGFTIESVKGTIEPGQVKCISVSWLPPADFRVSYSCYSMLLLKLQVRGSCFHRLVGAIQKLIFKMSAVRAALTHWDDGTRVVTKGSISWYKH